MTEKSIRLIAAFSKLSDDEKLEVSNWVKDYMSLYSFQKPGKLNEIIQKSLNLGPLDSKVCPYCGK